jgi:HSP20 family molecular chaperone IbpA
MFYVNWKNLTDLVLQDDSILHPVYTTKEGAKIEHDLPGTNKKDVKVQAKGNKLFIRAKTKNSGTWGRTYTVAEEYDLEKTSVKMKDGVLTIEIPFIECQRARDIPVE